jgi:hypothetical protein
MNAFLKKLAARNPNWIRELPNVLYWLIIHITLPSCAAIYIADTINNSLVVTTYGDAMVRLLCGLGCVAFANAPMIIDMVRGNSNGGFNNIAD